MIEPLPQLFSICAMARFNAFFLSSCIVETAMLACPGMIVKLPLDLAVPGESTPIQGDSQTRTKCEQEARLSTPPGYRKGVFHVPNPHTRTIDQYPDHIKPIRILIPTKQTTPHPRRPDQLPPLPPTH